MTTKTEIAEWFDRGVAQGASHMVIVVDTYDYDNYPVFTKTVEDARQRCSCPGEMQRVMEVYNLSMDKETQLNQHRVYNL